LEEATPSAVTDKSVTPTPSPTPEPAPAKEATPSAEVTAEAVTPDLAQYKELTIKETLTSVGKTYLADTNIAGTLTVGLLTFDELENSIGSLSGPLKLQANALQQIEFEGGKIEMDTNGDLHIKEGVIYGNESMRNAIVVPVGVAKFKVQSAKFKITVQNSKCEETVVDGEEATQNCELNWKEPPVSVTATPSWNTTVWVTDLTKEGFVVHFGTPPTESQKLYWVAIW